jgi:hypothetical protein
MEDRVMVRRLVAILALSLGVVAATSLFGCRGSDTTWSAEARSPDGKVLATASTVEQSGFGTGAITTTVYLSPIEGSGQSILILAFHDGPEGPGGMSVGLHWKASGHLELTYTGQRLIDFQASRCYGVDISVRDLSEPGGNSPAVK